MSIDLTKKAEKVAISLAKKGVATPPVMRVAAALDISYSMIDLYASGAVQTVMDQLLGIAFTFDDDKKIDTWFFNKKSKRGRTAEPSDYGTYIKKNAPVIDGGTNYAPVLSDVVDEMTSAKGGFLGFGSKKPKDPALLLFITDGANDDKAAAEDVIRKSQDKNIYFQLIGIGNRSQFSFIESMGDKYPNCGFISMSSINMSDDALYSQLISDELVEFVKKFV